MGWSHAADLSSQGICLNDPSYRRLLVVIPVSKIQDWFKMSWVLL